MAHTRLHTRSHTRAHAHSSTDVGGGTPVVSDLIWDTATATDAVFSNDNKTVAPFLASASANALTTPLGPLKYYQEVLAPNTMRFGFALAGSGWSVSGNLGRTAAGWGWDVTTGNVENDSLPVAALTGWAGATRLMLAMDNATGAVWLGKDGTWALLGNPGTGTGSNFTVTPDPAYSPAVSVDSGSCTLIQPANFLYLPAGFVPFPKSS